LAVGHLASQNKWLATQPRTHPGRKQRGTSLKPIVAVRSNASHQGLTDLLNGTISVELLHPPVVTTHLVVEALRQEPLVALLPVSHPLRTRVSLELADLTDEVLISYPSSRPSSVQQWLWGTLFVAGGALFNTLKFASGGDYASFADDSYVAFVADTWRSLVAPNLYVFIPLLIAFEVAVGVLLLTGGRRTQLALVGAIGFHLGLFSSVGPTTRSRSR
jgi:DNA-binding transcriptional LysR family regulator